MARTILLFHIISVRPSKQPRMVRTFLKIYMELGSLFLFLQEQIKDIIMNVSLLCEVVSAIPRLGGWWSELITRGTNRGRHHRVLCPAGTRSGRRGPAHDC